MFILFFIYAYFAEKLGLLSNRTLFSASKVDNKKAAAEEAQAAVSLWML